MLKFTLVGSFISANEWNNELFWGHYCLCRVWIGGSIHDNSCSIITKGVHFVSRHIEWYDLRLWYRWCWRLWWSHRYLGLFLRLVSPLCNGFLWKLTSHELRACCAFKLGELLSKCHCGQLQVLNCQFSVEPLIYLGCNKDQWSQRSKYKSYVALRGMLQEQWNGLLM